MDTVCRRDMNLYCHEMYFVVTSCDRSVTVKKADLTLFESLAFGKASDYVEVPVGEYTLYIRDVRESCGQRVGRVILFNLSQ